MADNASITILRNTQANINAEPIKDGNILFTTDQAENKIYADVGTTRIKIGGTVDVDTALSTTSTNPVQNKVITNNINDVRGQLQNLQVGGRNYLLGSNVKVNSGQTVYFQISDINTFNQNLGKPITLSIRYTAKNWTGKRFGFEMNVIYEDGFTLYPSIWIYDSADGNKTQSATYILPIEHGKIKSIEYPGLYVQEKETTAGTVTIYQPKLEIGNIPTDWTPAPEDVEDLFDVIRPIGSLYSTTDTNFNPNTAKGWHGTWERIKDCVIYASGDSDTVGSIVGSNTHKLTEAELPSHSHTIPKLTGTAKSHGIGGSYTALSSKNFGVGFTSGGTNLGGDDYWPYSGSEAASRHTHDVETNASNTGYTGNGTAIDIRPRRLNSVVWRRTA